MNAKQSLINNLLGVSNELKAKGKFIESFSAALAAIQIAQKMEPSDISLAQRINNEYAQPLKQRLETQSNLNNNINNKTNQIPLSLQNRGISINSDDENNKPCPKSETFLKQFHFDNLVGLEYEKSEFRNNFVFPYIFSDLYVKSKAILMYGPPGTGKTELAKAVSSEIMEKANIKTLFFNAGGSEMKSKWQGGTEKQIELFFRCAQDASEIESRGIAYKPELVDNELIYNQPIVQETVSILFMDELDAIAGKRNGPDQSMVHSTNALLSRMEGIKDYPNVIILAATNKPWNLDPAIERRFSLKLFVDLPDDETRRLKIYDRINKNYDKHSEKLGFDFIQKYGHSTLKLTAQDIDFIVKLTGINANVLNKNPTQFYEIPNQELIQGYKNKEFIKEIEIPSKVSSLFGTGKTTQPLSYFGYSMSDLNKMIDKAFNNAALRALTSPLIEVNPSEQNDLKNTTTKLIVSPNASKTSSEPIYYFQMVEDLVEKNGWPQGKILDSKYYKDIQTFDLRLEDFIVGLKKYPATIDPLDYIGYLYYENNKIAPPEGRNPYIVKK